MPGEYLAARFQFLQETQNSDGGWGYFPGKRSWLEPTAYALLAQFQQAGSASWDKAWDLVRSWQRPDGAFQPSSQVDDANWTTALIVSLHCLRGIYDETFRKGVEWLLNQAGAEGDFLQRIVAIWRGSPVSHDLRYRGWPWRPETSSWIEPTAHALVALKKAAPKVENSLLKRRVVLAEQMILFRRCDDGGWNYGNKSALGVPLPSYPETTALALLGLQGNRAAEIGPAVERAKRLWKEVKSPLAKAWLGISLKHYGVALPVPGQPTGTLRDVMLAALEVLAYPGAVEPVFRPARTA